MSITIRNTFQAGNSQDYTMSGELVIPGGGSVLRRALVDIGQAEPDINSLFAVIGRIEGTDLVIEAARVEPSGRPSRGRAVVVKDVVD